jgi:hypothetical protein
LDKDQQQPPFVTLDEELVDMARTPLGVPIAAAMKSGGPNKILVGEQHWTNLQKESLPIAYYFHLLA